MSSLSKLLEHAEPDEHIVQLYGTDEQLLARNVSRYFAEGLKRGDGLVLVATPEHSGAILRLLDQDGPVAARARDDGRLVCLDAQTTLDRFMLDGQPDQARFEAVIGPVLEEARRRAASGRVRAFGEMVALLWVAGARAAATRLEEHWNALMRTHAFSLFCAYPIDAFSKATDAGTLATVLGTHTHLLAGPHTLFSRARATD